jgi:hypothetical protein
MSNEITFTAPRHVFGNASVALEVRINVLRKVLESGRCEIPTLTKQALDGAEEALALLKPLFRTFTNPGILTLINVGDTVEIELPYSEVCMHMKCAGQRHKVRVAADGAYIQWSGGGESPVLHSEAGLHEVTHAT